MSGDGQGMPSGFIHEGEIGFARQNVVHLYEIHAVPLKNSNFLPCVCWRGNDEGNIRESGSGTVQNGA